MNVYADIEANAKGSLSYDIIEIRPHRWGWKVFEAPGAEPLDFRRKIRPSITRRRAAQSIPSLGTRQRCVATRAGRNLNDCDLAWRRAHQSPPKDRWERC